MKISAAVCFAPGEPWKIVDVDIDKPSANEVQVKLINAGLCHSDEHIRAGDLSFPDELLEAVGGKEPFPVLGGHEGAGIVESVGPGVTEFSPGDHVAVSFLPACGKCFWCSTGRQNLCDLGKWILGGPMISDGTWRHRVDGRPLNRVSQLGTFADTIVVHENSLVCIDDSIPFDVAALVSCGVATGFGSSVRRGKVTPGEVAVIVGCGGVGTGALLGAKAAGARLIIAVDPVPHKRDVAMKNGATHAFASMDEAFPAVRDLTIGRMAEVVVLTPDLLVGDLVAPALALASKDGRVVCTAMSQSTQMDVTMSLLDLATSNKALLGSLYGSSSPRELIPALLGMYRNGLLDVQGMITRRYRLSEVNDGYRDMLNGENIRGIIDFS